jgi:tRNA(fMet)-specific endonuclease VapC
MTFLLDTNTWIHYLKYADSPVRTRLERMQPTEIASCSVVRAELLHGAHKYGNFERRFALILQALAPFPSLPFDDAAAYVYGEVRHALEKLGQVIGPYDLQIAAICKAHGFVLVTMNVGEFARVDGLVVENWLA